MNRLWRRALLLLLSATNVVVLLPGQAHAVFASLTCSGAWETDQQSDTITQSEANHYWRHTASIYPKHTFTLSMSGGDVDLYVYNNSSCTSLVCSSALSGSSTDSCSVTGLPLSGTVFYIKVHYWAGSPAGSDIDYTISASSGVV